MRERPAAYVADVPAPRPEWLLPVPKPPLQLQVARGLPMQILGERQRVLSNPKMLAGASEVLLGLCHMPRVAVCMAWRRIASAAASESASSKPRWREVAAQASSARLPLLERYTWYILAHTRIFISELDSTNFI